jgi:hypothetical protein
VLQKLLMASAAGGAATRELVAVAGPYLVRVERGDGTYRPVLTELPTTLGPLRSVQSADVRGRRVLLVGAQSGFFVVPLDAPRDTVAYSDPSIRSPLGFSRVVYWGEQQGFCACHGEGGVVRWALDKTDAPISTYRPEQLGAPAPVFETLATGGAKGKSSGPRNLQVIDERRVIFSVGSRLMGLGMESAFDIPSESRADVVAIIPCDARLHVVHEDGTLCSLDRSTLEVVCNERRAGRVRAAGALPWLGEVRLLLASDDGPVHCVGFDDQLVTYYASPHQGLRVVAGAQDVVAAISADRQRLVLWNSWDGRKPAAEVHLGGVARHRIADVTFA